MLRSLRLPLLACLFAVGALASCSKDEADGLKVQAHNDNAFMTIMHDMSKEMDMMTATMDPDVDYAKMMVMHHTGAIKMAQKELSAGDNAAMKAIAQRMITAQQAEITQFNAFLTSHPAHAPMVMEFMDRAMMAMETMDKNNDLRVLTGDADQDFAQLMIDHHTSAIEMSEDELELGREATPKSMARQIITDQQMEVKELQDWLLANKSY
ncbi:DUF305 domain-containing protein [Hymenobacter lutimineralis]|uniref:DUF305 domain-containing protein n=1 Tax=Hymenobacter lutimineralis TaxID=2606448 RepID=A0A5D6UUJ8_9BACT|nr:DUF305 domain-containing protein [Hymenobacter lutimineralis]TYZ07236.1 DUF305 domain-containing protein [Hymenobacter lutimineralis]